MFHWYGLMIGVGVVAGMWVARRQAMRAQVDPQVLEEALLWVAVPAVIGARLYHVLTDWQLYAGRPWIETLKIWEGGLGFFGALLGGIVGIVLYAVYSQKKSSLSPTHYLLHTFTVLDLLSFGAPLAQAIGRLGNFFNQELYGLPTSLPWGISIRGQTYHPLFAYEAILNLIVFGIVNWLGWKKMLVLGKGQYACLYIACYTGIRFWLEFLRIETARMAGVAGFLSIAQWVALAAMIVAITVFWLRRHAPQTQWERKQLL